MKTEWIRKTIQNFKPYVVAPIAEKYVVNANENYINVLEIPEIGDDFLKALAAYRPEIYPKPMADDLREILAEYMNVKADNILCGNGGDEMITYFLGTFLNPGDRLLVTSPTFDMYELGAETLGAETIHVPDLPGYLRDVNKITSKIKETQPKVTIICNPNNPTGHLLTREEVRQIVEAADNLVLIDEAYMEFAGNEDNSVVPLIGEYDNLVVLRTLSKCFALAGLRCGYLIANPELISAVARIKNPYNLNSLTQLLAGIVVKHRDKIFPVRDAIIRERERLYNELSQIPGVTAYPSSNNFILIQVSGKQEEIFEELRKADVLVKIYRNNRAIPNGFRISVTTREVDDRIIGVIKSVLQ